MNNPAGVFSLMRQSGAQRRARPTAASLRTLSTETGRLSPRAPLAPGPAASARRASAPAPAARTKDGVQGRAAAVAAVGGGASAAAAPAAAEEAAPGGDAGGAAAGGRAGAEVRDGSLPGTAGGHKTRRPSDSVLQVAFSGRSPDRRRFYLVIRRASR